MSDTRGEVAARVPELSEYVACLNGQFVGYGYLEEVVQTIEIRSLGSYRTELMEAGTQVIGEIAVPTSMQSVVRQIIGDSRDMRFSGKIFLRDQIQDAKDIPVVILEAQYEMPFLDYSPILGFSRATQKPSLTLTIQADPNYRTQSLCFRCQYFIPAPFNTCNAFHPETVVSECADFLEQ